MKFLLPAAFVILTTQISISQSYNRELNGIPFSDGTVQLTNIFSGGINNLDFQLVDIDADNDLDLFFLDSDNSFGFYLNIGEENFPEYQLSFDTIPGLSYWDWFFFVDIDNDNDQDLFSGSTSNVIQFKRNIGSANSPSFINEIDTVKDDEGNPILNEYGSNPVFADVDGDNDYDFITGNILGTLTFFENTGTPKIFNFKFITPLWENLIITSAAAIKQESNLLESLKGKEIFNNYSNINKHGANSLEFIDIDNDGDLDLFWGDYFNRSLYYIENKGSSTDPQMEVVYLEYPPNGNKIFSAGFNMPRFADIDKDGDQDLFISILFDPAIPQSLIFYENTGSDFMPDFKNVSENFLKTFDLGYQSVPAFVDIDRDNDWDLFIASLKHFNGALTYIENTGSLNNPSFLIADSNFAEIKSSFTLAPAFGDLDGDGIAELITGNYSGLIFLYKNSGDGFQFQDTILKSDESLLDVGINAIPKLIDVDADGDQDLISGNSSGKFSFFKNAGSPQNYLFVEDTSYFGMLDVGKASSPFLADYDFDGDLDLFSGSSAGNIFYYRNDGNNLSPIWNIVTNNFLNHIFGNEIIPYFIDIDNDSDLDLFTGCMRGGLYFYRNNFITDIKMISTIPDDFSVSAYPNPFNPELKINLLTPNSADYKIILYNVLGEQILKIFSGWLEAGEYSFNWNSSIYKNNFSSGIYFLRVEGGNNFSTIKLVHLK